MPPPFNPSKSGPGGPRGLVRRTQSWYAPEPDAWAPTPPFGITTATVAQQAGLLPEQPAAWSFPRWYAPDASVEGLSPPAPPFNPAPFNWQEQPGQELERRQRWFQPDTEAWTPIPGLTVAPVAAQPIQQPEPAEQLEQRLRWYAPDEHVGPELPPTRLYPRVIGNIAAGDPGQGPRFPAPSGTWDTGTAAWRWMRTTRPATTATSTFQETSTAANQNVYDVTFVSPPLDGPQRIEGWVRALFNADELLATDDLRAQMLVRLFSGDGQVDRGTLLDFDNGGLTNEFSVEPVRESRFFPVNWNNALMTPLDAQDGDRIVIEVGFRAFASGATGEIRSGQHPTQDKAAVEGDTQSLINTWVQFSKAYKFRDEPYASWAIEQPGQERGWSWLWYAPEAAFEAVTFEAAAGFDPANGFDWSEQPQSWQVIRWYGVDPPPEGLTPPVAIFDLEEQPASWQVIRWHAIDPPPEGLVPPLAIFDLEEQPADWRPVRWTDGLYDAWTPIPGLTVADVEQRPTQVDELTEQLSRALTWFTPDDALEGLLPPDFVPPFDPADGQPLPEQPQDWLPATWFAPDAAFEGFVPLVSAVFDPGTGFDWTEQPASWLPSTWATYEPATEGLTPPLPAQDLEEQPGQERSLAQRWTTGVQDADWTPIPGLTVATVDQVPILYADLAEQRSTAQRWYQPEDAWEGLEAPVAPFDPSAHGGVWQEQPGQDKSLQPVWFRPDDDMLGRVPQAITTATVAQQAELWIEQPGQERSLAQRWFTREAEVSPPAAYLLSAPPAGVPQVLFDVETGDAYLSLGGAFIIKAS